MKETFKKFLLAMGVPQATIDAMIADDAGTMDIADALAAFKAQQRVLARNDVELISEIQGAEKGKQLDIITRKLKAQFKLAPELIKDKSVEEIITLAHTEATKGIEKPLQDLQNDLIAATNKIKDLEDVRIPAIQAEVEQKKKLMDINANLTTLITKKELRVPITAAKPAINSFLAEKYDLEMNDKGELVLYIKGSKLQPKNADGTALLTAEDAIDAQLKEFGFLKESNADDIDPSTGKKKIQPTPLAPKGSEDPDTNKKMVAHLSAAEQHLEKIKADDLAAKAAAEAEK